jgi:hypothetical protein
LRSELTRRHKYQRPNTALAVCSFLQALQHGQREAGRLARTRLGTGQNIAALQYVRDCLALDRGCLTVTLFFHSTQQFGRKAELIK